MYIQLSYADIMMCQGVSVQTYLKEIKLGRLCLVCSPHGHTRTVPSGRLSGDLLHPQLPFGGSLCHLVTLGFPLGEGPAEKVKLMGMLPVEDLGMYACECVSLNTVTPTTKSHNAKAILTC